jgi:broad specificity phosphatase PhoE
MRKLILIKHSYPDIDPNVLWHEWKLSVEGRRRCEPLADIVAEYGPRTIYTSSEKKAIETSEIVGARFGVPICQIAELRENDRTGLGIIPLDQIEPLFSDFFARPDHVVVGNETACAARDRFSNAVEKIVEAQQDGNVVLVAHGTVITLFVAAHNDVDPFMFWRQLGLPSVVTLALPEYRMLDVIARVGNSSSSQL